MFMGLKARALAVSGRLIMFSGLDEFSRAYKCSRDELLAERAKARKRKVSAKK